MSLRLPNIATNNENFIQKTPSNTTYYSQRYECDAINSHFSSVKVFEGEPDKILELDNVFFIPGYTSLYSSRGRRIIESCVQRGSAFSELIDAGPESIVIPEDYTTLSSPILYLSYFWNHWGHFLTECISRLWPRIDNSEIRKLPAFYAGVSGGRIGSQYVELLRAFGLNYEDNLNVFNRAVLFKKVFIPEASFLNRGKCYTVHKRVAEVISDYCRVSQQVLVSEKPVFLSRASIDYARKIVDERRLDILFEENGFRVVHLESQAVSSQIELFDSCRQVIGCWGAAFHGLSLSRRVQEIESIIFCEGLINTNYFMFDAICGNVARYVDCLRAAPGMIQKWPHTVSVIETDLLAPLLKAQFGVNLMR